MKLFPGSIKFCITAILVGLVATTNVVAQKDKSKLFDRNDLYHLFTNPPDSAKPWVFWYWMKGAVSAEGIKADLEAMKDIGIGGAYLVPIQSVPDSPLYVTSVNTLTPEWWNLLRFAFQEADRIGLKFAMHTGDGFATAGGPWITPELSMQKVTWSRIDVEGPAEFSDSLPLPPNQYNYYRDIETVAFPALPGAGVSTQTNIPVISTSNGAPADFLIRTGNKEYFRINDSCWIQYQFSKPFTCRSVITRGANYNYQSHRLRIETSNDGKNFTFLCQLNPSRNGWLDWDADYTHTVPEITARYFRFIFNKEGSEPGAEDMDMAKFRPNLKIRGLELSSEPVVHKYESKNGAVWRVADLPPVSNENDAYYVDKEKIINVTNQLHNGVLRWKIPSGKWTILRMGYTTTGHENLTAGAGKGLECDKMNPEAINIQLDHWFGEIKKQLGDSLTHKVLQTIHVDSWECGSQNWSPVFYNEFINRRGYTPDLYLPAMAGFPIENSVKTEQFLKDVRQTISELITEKFYGTLSKYAKANGFKFSAESVAPVGVTDGMLHYKYADLPMGEFWVNSPTHDKPTDMLEAISAAHLYKKNIVQSEAFTTLRMDWGEYPGMLKPIGDRNYALGVNRFVLHVFCQNPEPNRKPGMSLGPTGVFFQPAQTWWKPAKAWVEYMQRCQALLQYGEPVTDIAVFTGSEIPSRAVLPEHLVDVLPGLFSPEVLKHEKLRMKNIGQPLQNKPDGVTNSANIRKPEEWVDALQGYTYDSFNSDILQNITSFQSKEFGPGYRVLVFPGKNAMNPTGDKLKITEAQNLLKLIREGKIVILKDNISVEAKYGADSSQIKFAQALEDTLNGIPYKTFRKKTEGIIYQMLDDGFILYGPYKNPDFNKFNVFKKIQISENGTLVNASVAWTYRVNVERDISIIFLANQENRKRELAVNLTYPAQNPEIWRTTDKTWQYAPIIKSDSTHETVAVKLEPYESVFLVSYDFDKRLPELKKKKIKHFEPKNIVLPDNWNVTFYPATGEKTFQRRFTELTDWSLSNDEQLKYFSGTATYSQTINCNFEKKETVYINLTDIANLATIKINGKTCGTLWTPPYNLNIRGFLKKGENLIEIEVTNTWVNQLIGDSKLPENLRKSKPVFPPYRIEDKKLQRSGLFGPVTLQSRN